MGQDLRLLHGIVHCQLINITILGELLHLFFRPDALVDTAVALLALTNHLVVVGLRVLALDLLSVHHITRCLLQLRQVTIRLLAHAELIVVLH